MRRFFNLFLPFLFLPSVLPTCLGPFPYMKSAEFKHKMQTLQRNLLWLGRGLVRLPLASALLQLTLEMFILQQILLEKHFLKLIFAVSRYVFNLHIFTNHDNHLNGIVNITIYLMHFQCPP